MSNAVFPYPQIHLTFTSVRTMEWGTLLQTSVGGEELAIAQKQNPIWHWTLVYDYLKNYVDSSSAFAPFTDLQTLMGFYAARQGQFDSFLYQDKDDNAVSGQSLQLVNDGGAPATWYSPIQRNLGGLFYEDVTDLNPLNGSGLALKVNLIAASSANGDFSLLGPGLSLPGSSFLGLYAKWRVWTSGASVILGDLLIDPAGHLQKITTAGNLGSSIPTFNDSGSTTADGTAVWTDQGVAAVTASFSFYFRVRFDTDKQDFEKFLRNLWTIGGSEGRNGSGFLKMVTRRPSGI